MYRSTFTRAVIVAILTGGVIGCSCVKKEELDAVRAEVVEARKTADEALSVAKTAEQHSRDAVARAQRSEEAVSRGFKRSMRK